MSSYPSYPSYPSQYPKVQQWFLEVEQKNSLGYMGFLTDTLITLHKSYSADAVLNAQYSPEQKKWIQTVRMVGYDNPVLNELWQNKIITDGQRIFIPQQWFLNQASQYFTVPELQQHFKQEMDLVLNRFSHWDITPEQTKQHLIQAGLDSVVEKMFQESPSTPLAVLEKSWQDNSPIPQKYQAPFLNFFKKLERFNQAKNAEDLSQIQNDLIQSIEETWGHEFSFSMQLIPDILFNEWARHQKATHWTSEELYAHPQQAQQLWGLIGVIAYFLTNHSGMSSFLHTHLLGDKPSDNLYHIDNYWWKQILKKTEFFHFAITTQEVKEELIDAISGLSKLLNPESFFSKLNIFFKFQEPIIQLQKQTILTQTFKDEHEQNAFSMFLEQDIEFLKAYFEALKQKGWTGTLDSCVNYVPKNLNPNTLWKSIFSYFEKNLIPEKQQNKSNELVMQDYSCQIQQVFEKIKFLMHQGLTLQSSQAQDEFLDWFTGLSIIDSTYDFKLASLILERYPISSKKMLDSFFEKSEATYQSALRKGIALDLCIPFDERLQFLLESPFLDWARFSKEEKYAYFDKAQHILDGQFKKTMIALQRQEMDETLEMSQDIGSLPKTPKIRI